MIEQLFGSKTRVKLLQLFYGNPNRSFYVREITRKIDEQINSVRRELANLLSIGIISSDNSNNKLYYEVNQRYEFYKPLAAIFGGVVMSTPEVVIEGTIKKSSNPFSSLGNVELVLYTGYFTRDESSGIDILFVGDINKTQLLKFVNDLEGKEGHELRFVVMDSGELAYRRQVNDRFINLVLNSKKQVLFDKNGILNSQDKDINDNGGKE